MDNYQQQQPPPYGVHIPDQHVPMVQQPTPTVQVVMAQQLGPQPTLTVCPHCHAHITTNIRHEPSTKTHVLALISCLTGFWCCICVPYLVDSCQNANHYCPACQTYLGAYQV